MTLENFVNDYFCDDSRVLSVFGLCKFLPFFKLSDFKKTFRWKIFKNIKLKSYSIRSHYSDGLYLYVLEVHFKDLLFLRLAS